MRSWIWGIITAAVCAGMLLAGVGCGDDDDGGEGGTGATPTATGGTAGMGGAGGAMGGMGGVGGQATVRGGLIFGSSGTYMVSAGGSGGSFEVGLSILVARFDDQWTADLFSGACTQTTDGACVRAECPATTTSPSAPFPTAGEITLTGGVQDPVTLSADGNGDYTSDLQNTQALFNPGQTLSFAAAGDDVPSFDLSLSGPPSITLIAPVFSVGQVTIDTARDLALTWTGGSSGEVIATLGGSVAADDTQISVYCYFDAASGSGAVPASLMTGLATVEATSAFASVGAVSRQTSDAGGWDITVMLQTVASTELGGPAAGRATFQ